MTDQERRLFDKLLETAEETTLAAANELALHDSDLERLADTASNEVARVRAELRLYVTTP